MPKAAMHEDTGPVLREYEIGTPRQVFAMQAKSETGGVSGPPHQQLGIGVLPPNGAHALGSCFWA